MNTLLASLVALAVLPGSTFPRQLESEDSPPSFEMHLAGRIGDADARLTVSRELSSVSGSLRIAPRVPALFGVAARTSFYGALEPDGAIELKPGYDPDLSRRYPSQTSRPFSGTIVGTLTGVPGTTRASEAPHLVGSWTSIDGKQVCEVDFVAESLPDGLPYRIDAVASADGNIRRPRLILSNGRADRVFAALVERRVAGTVRNFLANSTGAPADPTSDDISSLNVDFELAYASRDLVSIRFVVFAWYVNLVRHDSGEEYAITYDLRRRRELTLEGELAPCAAARRALADMVESLCSGTDWARPYDEAAHFGGPDGWYIRPEGLALCFPVEQSAGSTGSVFVPWAFVRRSLRAESPLRRLAFAKTREDVR